MKVLIVFNHPAPYKVRIFNELAKYVDLTVIFERTKAKDRPDDFYIVNDYKFKTIFLKDRYIGREGTLSNKVRSYIKEHHKEYDQIIMNGYSHVAEMKAIKYMAKHHISFSLMINGGVIRNKEFSLKRKLKNFLVSAASNYISPSSKADEYLIYYQAIKENINRYSYSNFSKDEIIIPENIEDIRKKYNIPTDKKVFINASQFIERKNNLQLLSLFTESKYYLVLVGQGKLLEDYQSFIKENHMDNVMILPFMKKQELFELMSACDVLITLAKEDIFGHTTLEALANGLPVISSDKVISSLEYVHNDTNGYIVSLDNEEEIKKAMDKVHNLDRDKIRESVKDNTFENSAKSIYEALEGIDKHE